MSTIEQNSETRQWYALDPAATLEALSVDADKGLAADQARGRLVEYGPNQLTTEPPPSLWSVALGQLSNPMNIMLVIVAVASIAIGQVATGIFVALLVTFNVVMGSRQELKARASVDALAQLQVPHARVRRAGRVEQIDAILEVTDALMVAALKAGASVVGAAPNYDTDRPGQIHRVFEMAREFDVDIDMHLDSGASAEELDTLLVCDLTEKYGWGGRVAIGHVSKLASMRPPDMDKVARRLADAGVALTVLTATDLYLGGRHTDHNVPRNVVDLNRLAGHGVVCSVASNNILNPFTPFGDGQLLRQANMQAIITQRLR